MAGAPHEPDPRVERSRRVVLEATLAELAVAGYGALTVEAVADRAGVAKSTIYRHWQGRLPLVAEALRTLRTPPEVPDHGSAIERVTAVLEGLAFKMCDETFSACLPVMIDAAERDDEVREFFTGFTGDRQRVLVALVAEGVESGELADDTAPEIAAEALVGAIFFRRLLRRRPLDPGEVPGLVRQVLSPARSS